MAEPAPPVKIAYSIAEAAATLSMAEKTFRVYVLDDLRVVYVGSRRLIPDSELRRWVDRNATATSVGA